MASAAQRGTLEKTMTVGAILKGTDMKGKGHIRTSLVCLLTVMAFLVTSCVYVNGCGCSSWAKAERQVELSAPLAPGSSFSAETSDGSITLEGRQTGLCQLVATIRTHASSEERAEELLDQIQVRLEPTSDGLQTVIDRPRIIRNAGFGVSLTGSLPTETSLALVSSDGSIHLSNIEGAVDAKTSDGSIGIENVTGDIKLKTSDGSIQATRIEAGTLDLHTSDGSIRLTDVKTESCLAKTSDGQIRASDIRGQNLELRTSDGSIRCNALTTGRLIAHTSDGSIDIECTPETPSDIDASLTTSDGSITFAAPPNLSARIDASTSDGSIRTSLPIAVEGKIGKSLHGTVGSGQGTVTLKTRDGSITIK